MQFKEEGELSSGNFASSCKCRFQKPLRTEECLPYNCWHIFLIPYPYVHMASCVQRPPPNSETVTRPFQILSRALHYSHNLPNFVSLADIVVHDYSYCWYPHTDRTGVRRITANIETHWNCMMINYKNCEVTRLPIIHSAHRNETMNHLRLFHVHFFVCFGLWIGARIA